MDIGNFLDENHINEGVFVDDMFQPQMSDLYEENKEEEKEEIKYSFDNWKKVCAQALMQGYHKKDILARYKTNMKVAGNTEEVEKYLEQKDGLIGSIFVDCSAFDKNFDYNRCSKKLKKYHKFAINCNCDKFIETKLRKNASDGSIDGLLNEEAKLVKTTQEVCENCGLPVIHSLKEINREVLSNIVDELVESKEISFNEGKAIKSSSNILSSLRSIFANKVGQYKFIQTNTKVDTTASKYELKAQEVMVQPIDNFGSVLVEETPEVYEEDLELNNIPEEVSGVKMDVYIPEVEVNKTQDEITFDNKEYIDNQWFEQDNIELEENDIDKPIEEFNEVSMDEYIPIIKVNDKKDEIAFDNKEYIDNQWFEKEDIELEDKDFVAKKKDVKISNKFSFDF